MERIGQPYNRRDPTLSFDTIVVGSGIGGLAAAALLALHGGQRVLVLERHYMPGGFTHVFLRAGYEWDVGLHYIGGVQHPGSRTRRLFDHVTGGRLGWESMGEVYDRIVLGDRIYELAAGPDRFRETLKRSFPREAAGIDRYVATIRRVARWSGPYFAEKALPAPLAAVAGPLLRRPFLRHARRSTREALARFTRDPELAAVLTGQWGDYGLPPGRSSFAMHAILARHYLWGGSYPVGGSSAIAAGIAPLIEEAGGSILYNAEVAQILVEKNRAVGVRMADGTELRAARVISDAGASNTFERLLPRELAARHGIDRQMRTVAPSSGHLCVYVGFKRTARELGLPKANFWLYPGNDHDGAVERYERDPQAPLPVVYVSFPSAKDPTFEERYPGRATVELITMAPWERFEPWAGDPVKRRGAAYASLKDDLARRMFDRLEPWLPGIANQIDYYEVSTPLSTRHYANYARGELYGLDHTAARFERRFLRPRTPIRGLFLTGQDVATAGVAGALAGGYLTASAILGRNLLRAATG